MTIGVVAFELDNTQAFEDVTRTGFEEHQQAAQHPCATSGEDNRFRQAGWPVGGRRIGSVLEVSELPHGGGERKRREQRMHMPH